jgi:hypothetical protein
MNVNIEILEISPRVKYLKNNPSDILSVSLHSGKNISKIPDLEKAIKELQKINLIINAKNTIKLTLIRNNSTIIGITEFTPTNETKWLNLKEYKTISNYENMLTISSHKVKKDNLFTESSHEKISNYYLNTIKNTTIEANSSIQKYNKKSTINFGDACLNNIKIKILMKIDSKSKKKINKNLSLKTASSLNRGSSQIILNVCDKNRTINKNTDNNNNISMKDINEITHKDSNVIKDNSLKLKKKLKNAKSTSSIKLSLNQFTPNSNKFSLNAIYANINSNNKKKLNKNSDNKSLVDRKQKTQYNFNTKKSYLKDENEKNIIINQNYYNNTITFETNNKKIEDLIIDNNFKDKLKSDEIINPSNFHIANNKTIEANNINIDNDILLKASYQKNLNEINPINRELLKEISFNNLNLLNKEENNEIKLKGKKNNSSLNVPSMNYDYYLYNNTDKNRNNKYSLNALISYHDDEMIKNFERIKNDTIIYYTKEYLNSIHDDVLLLELNLIIDKILNLKFEYQKEYKFFLNNYIYCKKYIKYRQQKYINIMKKNNKLQIKKARFNFNNNNYTLFNPEKEKLFLSPKTILDNNETNIWDNLLNNKIIQKINDTKKNKMNNLFLFICEKNINSLNSLTKKYYLDIKNKIDNNNSNNNNNKNIKVMPSSELTSLITIQNINNENEKDENIRTLNSFTSKTIKNNLKTKKFYQNLKTTNRDENKKIQKNNLFLNSKSTEKKKIKKNKFYK